MRLTRIFFFLALLSLPIQLNKYLFLPYSYVLGLPIDYRAFSLYLSDICILLFLASFILSWRSNLLKIFLAFKSIVYPLFIFNVYLVINALITVSSPGPAFYFSLKFFEFSLFCLFTAVMLEQKQIHKPFQRIITFSLFWQSLILIGEFLKQGSLGLTFLGERSFSTSTTSIAHISTFGNQLLRPYGTFPHPNVAAAFLFIYLLILSEVASPRFFKKNLLIFIPITTALLLTFSKTIYLSGFLALVSLKKRLVLICAGFLAVVISVYWLVNLPDFQVASVSERLTLIQSALDISTKNPLFGVGSGNFILELAKLNLFTLTQIRLLQPVHNVFFLILSENGLIGLLIFSYLLLAVSRFATTHVKTVLFISLLVISCLDHFFWTLQQGLLLFFLSIAVIISNHGKGKT